MAARGEPQLRLERGALVVTNIFGGGRGTTVLQVKERNLSKV